MELNCRDPILLGVVDIDHFKKNHCTLFNKINKKEWEDFSNSNLTEIDIPFSDEKLSTWARKRKYSLS
jgi:hypothetical protein